MEPVFLAKKYNFLVILINITAKNGMKKTDRNADNLGKIFTTKTLRKKNPVLKNGETIIKNIFPNTLKNIMKKILNIIRKRRKSTAKETQKYIAYMRLIDAH